MNTHDWAPKMHAWLQGHVGIVPIAKLVDWGCERRTAYRLVDRGEFDVIMPGILRSTHWPLGRSQLMMAACWRNARAVICFLTAAKEWPFRGVQDHGQVHVMVPSGCSPTLPGVTVHRSDRIDRVDVVSRADGIRLTSPTRTLFDCADALGVDKSVSILEQLIDDGRGTFVTHAATLSRLAGRNRAGTRTMQHVIASRPAWRAAMQSELEVLVLAEIERQGLPRPEVQHRVRLSDGLNIRFDFAWPGKMAGLEVDHPFWHAGTTSSHRDKHRDLSATADGWLTMRITDLHVTTGLPIAIAKVAATLARR